MCNNGNAVNGKARPASAGRAAPFPQRQPVWLEYNSEQAREVHIIGSFNRWNPEITGMVRVNRSRWLRALFLPSGRYEYLFVVDGRCVADPHAESVPNVYGCANSVLIVPAFAPAKACARRRFTSMRQTPLKLNQRRSRMRV